MQALAVSTSNHPVLGIMYLATSSSKPMYSFHQKTSHVQHVPSEPFQPDDQPMVASGPSSGSKDGVPRRQDPQPEAETEVKQEPKVEVKV